MIDESILNELREFCEGVGGELSFRGEDFVACKLPDYDEASVDFTKGWVRVTVEGKELSVGVREGTPLLIAPDIEEGFVGGSIDISNIPGLPLRGELNFSDIREVAVQKDGNIYIVHIS